MKPQETAFYRHAGQRIRAHRRRIQMTQVDCAARIGISRPSLANIEVGRQRIDGYRLGQLAHVFGVTVDDLLRGPIPDDVALLRKRPGLLARLARAFR